jgi:acyl-CoA thioester hydrolase
MEPAMDDNMMSYEVHWADLDANRHMNYAAYIDAATDLRFRFLVRHGLSLDAFDQAGLGPVFTTLTAHFYREVRLGDTLTITYYIAGLSPQGVRWKIRHDFLKANGKKAVTLHIEGTIIDLVTRRPSALPPHILDVFQQVPRTPDFSVLPDGRSLRDRSG